MKTISAIAYTIGKSQLDDKKDTGISLNKLELVLAGQIKGMGNIYRIPILILLYTFTFFATLRYGRPFHMLPQGKRLNLINSWRHAPIPPCQDFVRFMESLCLMAFHSTDGEILEYLDYLETEARHAI